MLEVSLSVCPFVCFYAVFMYSLFTLTPPYREKEGREEERTPYTQHLRSKNTSIEREKHFTFGFLNGIIHIYLDGFERVLTR
jgi:hypothetical protein